MSLNRQKAAHFQGINAFVALELHSGQMELRQQVAT